MLLLCSSHTHELDRSIDRASTCRVIPLHSNLYAYIIFYIHIRAARASDTVIKGQSLGGQTLIMAYQKRLKKEYEEMSKRAPVGISLDPSTMEDNIDM